MIFESWYQKIHDQAYEAGYNAKAVEDHEAQNHRLEDMFKRGKEMGRHEAFVDGYTEGYKKGYIEGELDTRAEIGAISLDDLPDVEDFTGFKGLVNERGFVDDVSEAMEEVEA